MVAFPVEASDNVRFRESRRLEAVALDYIRLEVVRGFQIDRTAERPFGLVAESGRTCDVEERLRR